MSGQVVAYNGIPASDLGGVAWRKSRRSGPQGNCVELARLADGERVAMRNSRQPNGPALVYSRGEIATLVRALKSGEFDHLLQPGPAAL